MQPIGDILIIENQLDELRLLTHILESRGYQVRQAIDPEMALLAMEIAIPDLVLLNIKIYDQAKYNWRKLLKRQKKAEEIPIIFLGELNPLFLKTNIIDIKLCDHLLKPYQSEEVITKVIYHLKMSYLQKELNHQNQQLQKKLNLQSAAQQFYNHPQINNYLLQKAIAATLNGITITDATQETHPIIYVNEGFERMTGYSQSEVLEQPQEFLLGSDRNQDGIKQIYKAIQKGQSCCVILRNYRKDGSLFWNEMSLSPVMDENEHLTYYIWVQTDVSERIKAGEDKQRYDASLKRMNYELQELNEKLYRLANLDGLTEIANRRSFDHYFQQEWKRMTREKQPLSLILGDIDYFKRYNDTYGHIEGDNCLKTVAQMIQESVNRPADLVARFGGEEFAILLPNTPLSGAVTVGQSILKKLQERRLSHRASLVQSYVTMSLGVATVIPNSNLTPKNLIETADGALFESKKEGRNQLSSIEISS